MDRLTKFTILNEKPPEGHMWSAKGLQQIKQLPDLSICAPKVGLAYQKQRNEVKSSCELSRNRSSTVREG